MMGEDGRGQNSESAKPQPPLPRKFRVQQGSGSSKDGGDRESQLDIYVCAATTPS